MWCLSKLLMKVSVLFICNSLFLLYSLLMIFYTMMSQSLIMKIRLIVELSFHIYILTQFNYLSQTSWFDSITWVKHSDLTWYQSQVRIRFKFLTQLIKQSKMTSKELNIEIFPVFRLCIIFLHYLFDRKS